MDIIVANENSAYCSINGVLYTKDKSTIVLCPGGKKGDFTIPTSVETVGTYSFFCCYDLTSVSIPNSVKSIEEYAFSWCKNLTSATIGNSVSTIGNNAFFMSGLHSVTIPKSVTYIGESAFEGCPNLSDITVEEGNNNYCSENGVLYTKNKEVLVQCPGGKEGDFIIPNNVTTIGNNSFSNCGGITSVTFPNSVTTIGKYAFYNCGILTSVNIPEGALCIDNAAFSWCDKLTSVHIPNSITSIGNNTFSGCKSLESVYCAIENPDDVTYGSNIFAADIYPSATLYVPESTVDKYKATEPWCNFRNIIGIDFTEIKDIETDINTDLPYDVYNLSGICVGHNVEKLAKGIYLIRQGNSVKKLIK